MKYKQPKLPGFDSTLHKAFGGAHRDYKKKKSETRGRKKLNRTPKGNATSPRPITTKFPIHLVMRSSQARGSKSFLIPERALKIQKIIHNQEKKFGVKVKAYANSGNHLHLVVLPRSRSAFTGFLRSISGLIARETLRKQRGKSTSQAKTTPKHTHSSRTTKKKFWDAIPFTRVLSWGRELNTLTKYLEQNSLEAFGFSTIRKPIKQA